MMRKYLSVSIVAIFGVLYLPSSMACVSDSVQGNGTASPTIIIYNGCSKTVHITGCYKKSSDQFGANSFTPRLAPGQTFRQGLWLQAGETFRYRYNADYNNYPSRPNC
jgi:hypothetical protein